MDRPHLVIHSSVDEYWGCFHFWATMSHTPVNTHVEVLVCTYVFHSLVIYLGMKSLGFLRNGQTIFHKDYTLYIPTSDAWRIQFLHIVASTYYFLLLLVCNEGSLFSLSVPSCPLVPRFPGCFLAALGALLQWSSWDYCVQNSYFKLSLSPSKYSHPIC